jgi:hypothetical protein
MLQILLTIGLIFSSLHLRSKTGVRYIEFRANLRVERTSLGQDGSKIQLEQLINPSDEELQYYNK